MIAFGDDSTMVGRVDEAMGGKEVVVAGTSLMARVELKLFNVLENSTGLTDCICACWS